MKNNTFHITWVFGQYFHGFEMINLITIGLRYAQLAKMGKRLKHKRLKG